MQYKNKCTIYFITFYFIYFFINNFFFLPKVGSLKRFSVRAKKEAGILNAFLDRNALSKKARLYLILVIFLLAPKISSIRTCLAIKHRPIYFTFSSKE